MRANLFVLSLLIAALAVISAAQRQPRHVMKASAHIASQELLPPNVVAVAAPGRPFTIVESNFILRKLKLRQGDKVLAVCGVTVHSAEEFVQEVGGALRPGNLTITVLRNGRKLNLFTDINKLVKEPEVMDWLEAQRNCFP